MITLAMVAALAMPPPRYDHEPTRPYAVQHVSEAYMRRMGCKGFQIVGCTLLDRYVLLHENLTPEAAAIVLRHELGHINGWEH